MNQRRLRHPLVEVALARHVAAARDEVQHLADEFLELALLTTVPTPAIDRLYARLRSDCAADPGGQCRNPARLARGADRPGRGRRPGRRGR